MTTGKPHSPFLHHRSRRLHVVCMLLYAFFCMCQMTAHIGLSLSCMCNSTAIIQENSSNTSLLLPSFIDEYANVTNNEGCTQLQGKVVKDYGGEFLWSVKMQGYIVSAAFFGGFLFAYPAGYAVDRYSSRHLVSFSIGLLTVSSFILPIFSHLFGAYGAIVVRFLMGIGETFLIPSLNAMVTKWIPLHEKSLAASMFTAGNQLAGMFGTPLVAEICASSLGWSAIFYSGGMFGVLWLLLWHLTIRNSPQNTKWIHEHELDYLANHIPPKHNKSIKKKTPWKRMLTSSVFWCLMFNSVMGNLMIAIIFVYIPVYFKDVLMLDVQSNGFYSAIPHLTNLVAKISWGFLMDKMKQKKILSPTAACKLSQVASMIGIATSCFFLRFMDCSTPVSALLLLSLVSGSFGLSISGFYTSLLSVAPSHIGTLTSLASVIGFLGRMTAPQLISFFKTVGTAEEWGNVLLVYVFASTFSAVVFLIYGSGDVQEWDYSKTHATVKPEELILVEEKGKSMEIMNNTSKEEGKNGKV